MRLITFISDGAARAGAIIDDADGALVIDLAGASNLFGSQTSAAAETLASVHGIIAGGDTALAAANRIVELSRADDARGLLLTLGHAQKLADVRCLPPIPRPGKIICIGQNYRAHVVEMGRELPKHPVLFAKFANTLVGHEQPIRLPRVSGQVDYEAELMIVIGRECKDVAPADAFDVIAGYTIFNDVSVRDYQRRTTQFLQGKTFDTTGPCGPAIVTKDEVADPHALRVQLRLNGETMQDGNTSDFIFDIPAIISYLSEIMTLEPGDLIATGTPEGVGFARDPQVFLKAGDVVEIEIDGLSVLRNPVVSA